jgi:AcrB/AcrD/AcrF family
MAAGTTRFRPVLMTALKMIIGMMPRAIEPGENMPLGRAIIGCLMFMTYATLVLVQTLFSVVHSRAHRADHASPAFVPPTQASPDRSGQCPLSRSNRSDAVALRWLGSSASLSQRQSWRGLTVRAENEQQLNLG